MSARLLEWLVVASQLRTSTPQLPYVCEWNGWVGSLAVIPVVRTNCLLARPFALWEITSLRNRLLNSSIGDGTDACWAGRYPTGSFLNVEIARLYKEAFYPKLP